MTTVALIVMNKVLTCCRWSIGVVYVDDGDDGDGDDDG